LNTRLLVWYIFGAFGVGLVACGGKATDSDGLDKGLSEGGGASDEPLPSKPPPSAGGMGAWGGGAGGAGAEPVPACGNGRVDPGETCDGSDFAGETCVTVTEGTAPYGHLSCRWDCEIDATRCLPALPPATGGSGGAPADDPYTCFARQAAGEPSPFLEPSGECGGWEGAPLLGYCVARDEVPYAEMIPQDSCVSGELCYPKLKVDSPGSCFARCESSIGGAGACVPTYIIESPGSAGQGLSSVLGQQTCDTGETCTPCVSPLDGQTTGACDN
jgi:hypothetical protein